MLTNIPAGNQPPVDEISKDTISLSQRITSLDVLRGIAVLFALVVSVWVFGGFSTQQQHQLLLQSKGWNYRLFGAVEILFDGKMRAIIALVFGAAMVLFLTKETEAGKQPASDIFIKRQLWLIIFGIINAALLLWTQDILFHLGIMGILLFPFVRISHRGLLIAAIMVTFFYSGKYLWDFADDKKMYSKYLAVVALEKKHEKDSVAKAQKGIVAAKDSLNKFQKQDKAAWEGKLAALKVDLKKDEGNTKAMRSGSYGKVWNHLLPATQGRQAQWTYRFGIWDFAGMILLGMLLYKIGFFTHRFGGNRYLGVAIVCLTAGVLMGWFRLHFQQLMLQDYVKYITAYSLPHTFFFPLERAFLAIGYSSIVMLLLHVRFLHRIWAGLAAVGKLALTNYLMQTIICTVFFYGYGMGYFGRLSQIQLYLFVAEIIMLQIVFSVVWIRFYNYGPAEWGIRRLSAGKWLPKKFVKPKATDVPIPVLS